jgi:hypothetical protein
MRFCSVCNPRMSLDIPANRKSTILMRLSIRVFEKIGMTFDREIIFRGVVMDCYKIVK